MQRLERVQSAVSPLERRAAELLAEQYGTTVSGLVRLLVKAAAEHAGAWERAQKELGIPQHPFGTLFGGPTAQEGGRR